MAKSYWLMKTEPDKFSFDDLVECKNHTDHWDGIRNYQARNFIRDDFRPGDGVFVYHSRIAEPAIVGVAEVVSEPYPDESALDPKSKYFDEKSKARGESRWVMVDVKATHKFAKPVTLNMIREHKELSDMMVIKKGARLSIQPVTSAEWAYVRKLTKLKKI